jgi:hypothetical protein
MSRCLSVFFFLAAFSCEERPSHLTTNEREKIVATIRETLDNYYRDVKTAGLTAEFKYLDNSSDFFWVPPGYSTAISYDSVVSVLNQNAPLFKSINNTFDTVSIIPLSAELATYTARISSVMTDTASKVSSLSLIETGVLIKRRDGWKLLCGQTSVETTNM